jgi:hypothetical protein
MRDSHLTAVRDLALHPQEGIAKHTVRLTGAGDAVASYRCCATLSSHQLNLLFHACPLILA